MCYIRLLFCVMCRFLSVESLGFILCYVRFLVCVIFFVLRVQAAGWLASLVAPASPPLRVLRARKCAEKGRKGGGKGMGKKLLYLLGEA